MGIVSQSAAKGKIVADDPQGLLYLTARYIEALRVRNFAEQTLYGRGKMLRYFRVFCEQIGVTQARQVTRAVMINYQSLPLPLPQGRRQGAHHRHAEGMAVMRDERSSPG